MSKIPQVKEFQGLPVVTPEKIRVIDKKAVAEYGVAEGELMENAGRGAADEILRIAAGLNLPAPVKIAVCCGKGNNGGDGLVAARYLKRKGAETEIFILEPKDTGYGELVVKNLEAARAAGVKISLVRKDSVEELAGILPACGLLVDALLGIGSMGKPAGTLKRVIQLMNKSGRPIVALDLPSGLLPDTGHHTGVYVIASHTLTFGLAKTGLMAAHAQKNIGELKVIDIGYPPGLVAWAGR
ncbi:MAG: NAD(P)H-hydrate epimerase [Elusimicrobiales bacterium]|nr:NAD(P)H-hydrate epimerase [Elusimicrobiales bacterium]